MKVWVAIIDHRHGQNVHVAETEEKAVESLYAYVKDWWKDEIPQKRLPRNKKHFDVVKQYFELVEDEGFYLEQHEVL